jgi:hypothetical protein
MNAGTDPLGRDFLHLTLLKSIRVPGAGGNGWYRLDVSRWDLIETCPRSRRADQACFCGLLRCAALSGLLAAAVWAACAPVTMDTRPLGLAIPGLIFALTKASAVFWIEAARWP